MFRNRSLITKVGGFGLATLLRRIMQSVEIKITHYDRSVDPTLPEFKPGIIYVFWHEYIAFPIALWREYDLALLVSRHRDADWLIRAAYHLGFETVRGSTNRGGTEAIRELKRKAETHDLVITPDGPRGPRREMAMGPIYLASRLRMPIVPVGFGFDRPYRMRTWDRFAFPRVASKGRAIFGPRLEVPPKLKRDGLEAYRLYIEQTLNRLCDEAELWVESGERRQGEMSFARIRKAYDQVRCDAPQTIKPWHVRNARERAAMLAQRSRRAG